MAISPHKRTIMALYTREDCPYSHRVRMVLIEKDVVLDIIDIDKHPKAREEVNELNPYGTTPLLIDRDLVLYQSEIIMEYLDERYPHPPLMPVYPVARGRARLMMYRINRDWYSLMEKILKAKALGQEDELAKKELRESILSIAPVFAETPYFLSEDFSLMDCCIAPLLWRLPILGIELPPQGKAVLSYAARIFERGSFLGSLTETEKAMRS